MSSDNNPAPVGPAAPSRIYLRSGFYNPELAALVVLLLARCVAVAGYTFRCLQEDHSAALRSAVLATPRISLLTVAILILTGYTVWLLLSSIFIVWKLLHSSRHASAVMFEHECPLTTPWVFTVLIADSVFFAMFFVTTTNPESDLFLLQLVPVIWAGVFVRRVTFLVGAGVLVLGIFVTSELLAWDWGRSFGNPLVQRFNSTSESLQLLVGNVILLRATTLVAGGSLVAVVVAAYRHMHGTLLSIIDNVPAVLWRKWADGRFSFANRHLLESINLAREQLLTRTDREVFGSRHEGYVEIYERGDRHALLHGHYVNTQEPFPTPGGREQVNFVYKVAIYADKMRSRAVQTQGFFLNKNQISAGMQDALLLSAVGQHTENVNHILGNIINLAATEASSVCLLLGMALEERDWGHVEVAAEKAARTDRACIDVENRLRELVQIRMRRAKRQRVELAKFIREVIERQRSRVIPCRVTVREPAGKGEERVWVDEALLEHALTNLLLNACEALLRAHQEEKEDDGDVWRVRVDFKREGGRVGIEVRNVGVIERGIYERILAGDPWSSKGGAERAGLGLVAVRDFARTHGGEFNIVNDSEHNRTRCIIWLPTEQ